MRCIVFLLGLLLISCKSDTKKEPQITTPEPMLKELNSPSGDHSSLPRLFTNNDKLYLSWVEKEDSLAKLYYSVYENETWQEPEMIVSGTDWFVNWADFPAIAEKDGNILTNFLQKSADGTYTYDVKLNLYNASEDAWKKNFILHNDGTQSEHGFVSMVPTDENDFFVTWLDGRETVGKGHGGGQMTLRGAFVNMDGTISGDTQLDGRICDCCQTTAAMTSNGPIVAYRDRSDDEIRDISIVRALNGQWSDPVTIGNDNWKIAGCPVNGPAMDIQGTGIGLAWFTAANENAMVNVAFSHDEGANFGEPIRIDSGNAIGRVDLSMLNATSAAVVWLEPSGGDTLIQLVKVSDSGEVGTPVTITKTSPERASGFPQLELVGDRLFLAWTSLEGEISSIKMTSLNIDRL